MDSKIIKYFIVLILINFKSYAVEFQGKFIQGHFIIGKTEPGTEISIDKKIISSLQNIDSLERYAREKLYMKKENEEIYIIEYTEE